MVDRYLHIDSYRHYQYIGPSAKASICVRYLEKYLSKKLSVFILYLVIIRSFVLIYYGCLFLMLTCFQSNLYYNRNDNIIILITSAVGRMSLKTPLQLDDPVNQYELITVKQNMSRDMGFQTMWYVRPAKAQISLRIRAVCSEPLQAA